MKLLYSILYIAAEVCFLISAFGMNRWAVPVEGTPRRFSANLVALGLFLAFLVPTILMIRS